MPCRSGGSRRSQRSVTNKNGREDWRWIAVLLRSRLKKQLVEVKVGMEPVQVYRFFYAVNLPLLAVLPDVIVSGSFDDRSVRSVSANHQNIIVEVGSTE